VRTDQPVQSSNRPSRRPTHEYVVVGGGIHGTCLANYLRAEGGYATDELRVVEPRARLLDSFETKARNCGMRTLRSGFLQHVDTEPFSLRSFAAARDREEELVATSTLQRRPTLDLFLDHARAVVDRRGLDALHHRARVTGLSRRGDRLRVATDDATLDARRVVLAVGLGARPTVPGWAESLADTPWLAHVWDGDFDPTAAGFDGPTYVVGGGITAAQVACHLAPTADVTLLSRHELSVALTEASPEWLDWRHVEREIHSLPPGSSARHERIRAARNDGTVPPYALSRLDAARECADLTLRLGEIVRAHATDEGLFLRFADGTTATGARVVLATGLDPVVEHPLVERVAAALGLARDGRGYPVLDDRTLAWRHTDGTASRVTVSGALAAPTVGPFAQNIAGAHRAAERLLAADEHTGVERRDAHTRAAPSP
jgi:hypothetical protein